MNIDTQTNTLLQNVGGTWRKPLYILWDQVRAIVKELSSLPSLRKLYVHWGCPGTPGKEDTGVVLLSDFLGCI